MEDDIGRLLAESNTIAVVGLSPKPERPSHDVASYLQAQGYRIIPVNPGHPEILGEKCYRSLLDVPDPVDIVDIFRREEFVPDVVDAAVAISRRGGRQAARPLTVWMQLGIVHDEAAERARAAGLMVVMDRCLKVEHMSRAWRSR